MLLVLPEGHDPSTYALGHCSIQLSKGSKWRSHYTLSYLWPNKENIFNVTPPIELI